MVKNQEDNRTEEDILITPTSGWPDPKMRYELILFVTILLCINRLQNIL